MNKKFVNKKNIKWYFFAILILILAGILIFLVYHNVSKNNNLKNHLKDNPTEEIIYKCIKEEEVIEEDNYYMIVENGHFVTRFSIITRYTYNITADNENRINDVLQLKQYIFDNKERYAFRIHTLIEKNVDFERDDNNLTITMYPHKGPLLDENGNNIEMNIDTYITSISKDGYSCSKIN